MESLPLELVGDILKYLPIKDRINFSAAYKVVYDFISSCPKSLAFTCRLKNFGGFIETVSFLRFSEEEFSFPVTFSANGKANGKVQFTGSLGTSGYCQFSNGLLHGEFGVSVPYQEQRMKGEFSLGKLEGDVLISQGLVKTPFYAHLIRTFEKGKETGVFGRTGTINHERKTQNASWFIDKSEKNARAFVPFEIEWPEFFDN